MRAVRRVLLLLALGASLGATGACTRAATQLVVEVGSDLPPSRLACVRVEVAPVDDAADVSASTFHVALADGEPRVAVPFSFGVTPPGGDPSRRIELRASAHPLAACAAESFEGRALVERRVRTGWLPDHALRVPIFLSADCLDVACGETETCDGGRCVPVPDLAPADLVITTERDDAGTATRAPTFAETRTSPVVEVGHGPALNLHDAVYPVGASGGEHVLVAGALTGDLTIGAQSIAAGDGVVFLAELGTSAGESPAWVAILDPAAGTFPVIRRALRMPSGVYALCGTATAPFVVEGRTVGGGAAHFAFVGLIGPDGQPLPDSFHTLDADPSPTMGTPSPHARCADLAMTSPAELVAAVRVWNAGSPRVDSGTRPTLGAFLDTAQNLLLYRIGAGSSLTVADPIVVGHAETTAAMDTLEFEGAPYFVRGMAGDQPDVVIAAVADDLAHEGTARTDPSVTELSVRRVGPFAWSRLGLVSSAPPIEVHLEALEVSPSYVWLAVTLQLGTTPSSDVTIAPLPPATITRDATYLVRLDAATGDAIELITLPENVDAAFEDTTGAALSEDNLLYGGWLATTGRDEVLYATAATDGSSLGSVSLGVTGGPPAQTDPLLVLVGGTSARLGAWQWTHAPEHADWRLTHVTWIPSGYVAVAGYVESTGTEAAPDRAWRRERSFFEILPAR